MLHGGDERNKDKCSIVLNAVFSKPDKVYESPSSLWGFTSQEISLETLREKLEGVRVHGGYFLTEVTYCSIQGFFPSQFTGTDFIETYKSWKEQFSSELELEK